MEVVTDFDNDHKEPLKEKPTVQGYVVINGKRIPMVIPSGEPHQMDLDREVCATWMKQFVRPRLPSDNLDPADILETINGPLPPEVFTANVFKASHILVREVKPGHRIRQGINVTLPK